MKTTVLTPDQIGRAIGVSLPSSFVELVIWVIAGTVLGVKRLLSLVKSSGIASNRKNSPKFTRVSKPSLWAMDGVFPGTVDSRLLLHRTHDVPRLHLAALQGGRPTTLSNKHTRNST